jgi:hypothetical protein
VSEEQRAASDAVKRRKVDELKRLSEDELEAEFIEVSPHIPREESAVELRVRQIRVVKSLTAALEKYTQQATEASDRLEKLTWVLIGLTIVLAVLTAALLWRALLG